eukprot:3935983-Rhodomonas_salina.1
MRLNFPTYMRPTSEVHINSRSGGSPRTLVTYTDMSLPEPASLLDSASGWLERLLRNTFGETLVPQEIIDDVKAEGKEQWEVAEARFKAKQKTFKERHHKVLALLICAAFLFTFLIGVIWWYAVLDPDLYSDSYYDRLLPWTTVMTTAVVFCVEQMNDRLTYVVDTNAPKYSKQIGGTMTQMRTQGLYPIWILMSCFCHWTITFGVILEGTGFVIVAAFFAIDADYVYQIGIVSLLWIVLATTFIARVQVLTKRVKQGK